MTLDDELQTHPEDIETASVEEGEGVANEPIESLDDVIAVEQENITENI